MAKVKINGVDYFVEGSKISLENNKILVNGQEIDMEYVKAKEIKITIEGNVESLIAPCAQEINIIGNVGSIQTKTGDISIQGDVTGDIKTERGSVDSFAVGGNVSAGGDVNCGDVNGNVSAGGTVDCGEVKGGVYTGNGNIHVSGDVAGGVNTKNGNIDCGDIGGGAIAQEGDIDCNDIQGDVSIGSGRLDSKDIYGDVIICSGDINCGNVQKPDHE